MRESSVASIKGTITCPRQKRPRPGTRIGAAYDLLMASKGKPIRLEAIHSATIVFLNNMYGLDIRHANIKGHYILAGEWFGRVYVDYVVNPGL